MTLRVVAVHKRL